MENNNAGVLTPEILVDGIQNKGWFNSETGKLIIPLPSGYIKFQNIVFHLEGPHFEAYVWGMEYDSCKATETR